MKRVAIVMAAMSGLTFGAMAPNVLAGSATNAPSATHLVADANVPAAKITSSLPAESGIRNLMEKLTNDALGTKGMAKLVGLLDQHGQQRIMKSDSSEGYGAKLETRIEGINSAWKEKYGHDFSVSNAGKTFDDSFVTIQEGSPATDAHLASKVLEAMGQSSANANSFKADSAIALAEINGGNNRPALQISLIHQENGGWKIASPGSLTATKLRDNLLSALSAVNAHSAKWPANEMDAYRDVSRHVLMAVMDKATPSHDQANAIKVSPMDTQSAPAAAQSPSAVKQTAATSGSSHGSWWKFWSW